MPVLHDPHAHVGVGGQEAQGQASVSLRGLLRVLAQRHERVEGRLRLLLVHVALRFLVAAQVRQAPRAVLPDLRMLFSRQSHESANHAAAHHLELVLRLFAEVGQQAGALACQIIVRPGDAAGHRRHDAGLQNGPLEVVSQAQVTQGLDGQQLQRQRLTVAQLYQRGDAALLRHLQLLRVVGTQVSADGTARAGRRARRDCRGMTSWAPACAAPAPRDTDTRRRDSWPAPRDPQRRCPAPAPDTRRWTGDWRRRDWPRDGCRELGAAGSSATPGRPRRHSRPRASPDLPPRTPARHRSFARGPHGHLRCATNYTGTPPPLAVSPARRSGRPSPDWSSALASASMPSCPRKWPTVAALPTPDTVHGRCDSRPVTPKAPARRRGPERPGSARWSKGWRWQRRRRAACRRRVAAPVGGACLRSVARPRRRGCLRWRTGC
eukprot:scaffold1509_cov240-Pinguiococcus_pyrenoidosus.AAC.5